MHDRVWAVVQVLWLIESFSELLLDERLAPDRFVDDILHSRSNRVGTR